MRWAPGNKHHRWQYLWKFNRKAQIVITRFSAYFSITSSPSLPFSNVVHTKSPFLILFLPCGWSLSSTLAHSSPHPLLFLKHRALASTHYMVAHSSVQVGLNSFKSYTISCLLCICTLRLSQRLPHQLLNEKQTPLLERREGLYLVMLYNKYYLNSAIMHFTVGHLIFYDDPIEYILPSFPVYKTTT